MRTPTLAACALAAAALLPADQLLVANKGDQAVGIIDPATNKQLAEIPEGGITAHELIASRDGKLAYAPIYGNSGVGKPGTDGSTLAVIDLAARKVVSTYDFKKGVRPHCPLIGPKDGLLYVTTELEKAITVFDPKTMKVVATIPTGQEQSHMLVLSHDGRRGYTANVGPGTVSVLDLAGRKVVTVIPISPETQRISISNDDKWVFTADQKQPRLAVIDTSSNKVAGWVDLPAFGYGTAPTIDGKYLVVAVPNANKVSVVDLQTRKVIRNIEVPRAPQEVLVRPDGKMAYVSSSATGKIAAIRTSDWTVETLIDAGKDADGLAWASSH
jgi:YVTN family beta-propeller protein